MRNKKYLVTGGTGFIGSALVKTLLAEGLQVRVLDNDSRGNRSRLLGVEGQYEFVQGDICNLEDVQRVTKGVHGIFHLAAVNGTENFYSKPERVLEVAVKGMVNILDAAISSEVKDFFLASSSEVYQTPSQIPTAEEEILRVPDVYNPRFSYGGGKIISELLLANYGRKFFDRAIIFRPHNVYGPDMGFEHVIPQFAMRMSELVDQNSDRVIPFRIQGSGKETRAFIYINDFINGLILLMRKGEHLNTYHIGSDVETPIKDVAYAVSEAFDRKIELVAESLQPGSTLRRCPDIAKIKSLGFNITTSLLEGIKYTTNWYKEQKIKI
ncbi:MAG: NAD-dependent epimerase/dehydratase family protein [Bacteroidota bacterium]